jgi:hypothetical protein
MVRYLICATLLVITAAAHAQSSTDHVVISLKREYGRALYTECRLSLVVFQRQGRASLWCALNTAGGKSLRAERQLTPQEAGEFPALVAAGKLCSGGHLGRDDTASDGILETLQTRCSEGTSRCSSPGVIRRSKRTTLAGGFSIVCIFWKNSSGRPRRCRSERTVTSFEQPSPAVNKVSRRG